MSKPPKFNLQAMIDSEIAPAFNKQPTPEPAAPEASNDSSEVVTLKPRRAPASAKAAKATLKERAHQLSVYLETPVYDALREIAHAERTKLHPLILEAIDMLLKRRGSPSIKELTKKTG